jgi:hypothetical protein
LGSTEIRFYAIFPNPGGLFMTAARSFLRLAFGGLFVGSLAMACVVDDSGGDDDELANTPCEDGDFRQCTCPDGDDSVRECNASNTGYGACQCEGSPTAGTSNGGSANNAGEGNTTAGTNNTNYGGEPGSMGGAPAETGGNGPDAGGAGGAGPIIEPGLCDEDPNDTCADCYQQGCCEQWTACANDDTCLDEFLNIMACTDVIKSDRNVLPADLQTCAEDEGAAAGPWSQGVSALTVDMVNCVGGEPDGGWESMPWGAISCKAGCFDN